MRTLPAALLVISCLSTPFSAQATTFYERPFEDSVKDAPVIARGKVGVGHSEWGEGDDKVQRIYTYYDLSVSEALKGSIQTGTQQIRTLGGEKDGVGMQVSGAPTFSAGEDVVVFLGPRNGDGSYDVFGLMMGKFLVVKDADGGERLDGPGLGTQPHSHERGQGDSRGKSKWTLDDLRKLLAQAPKTQETSVISASAQPSPSPSAGAPALQPQQPEESSTPSDAEAPGIPFGFKLLLGCVLGVAGFLLARSLRGGKRP